MDYLLDTTAFSDLIREQEKSVQRVATLPSSDRLLICPIVRGEVNYGIRRLQTGKKQRALEAKVAILFATILCVPVPENAGDHYAQIKIARQRIGLTLDENDLWIAAIALALRDLEGHAGDARH